MIPGVHIIKTGPFWDASGTAAATSEAVDDVGREVALDASRNWNLLLESRIRVNQYRYMSGNRIEPRDSSWVVHDDIAKPYGPWLEGLGSRNAPVTRFEGYHALRDAAELADRNATAIGNARISRLTERLNTL